MTLPTLTRSMVILISAMSIAMLGMPGLAAASVPIRAHHAAAQCGALGTYEIGPRYLRMRASAGLGLPHTATVGYVGTSTSAAAMLHGTLVITRYSGCGQFTAGTFSVHTTDGLSSKPSVGGRGVPCKVPCGPRLQGIDGAVGAFAQDMAHPHDPMYVTVSATISTSIPAPRSGPLPGLACSQTGCLSAPMATSTVAFTSVTGYLQVPSSDGRMVTLSFLPPPSTAGGAINTALVLEGWRVQP